METQEQQQYDRPSGGAAPAAPDAAATEGRGEAGGDGAPASCSEAAATVGTFSRLWCNLRNGARISVFLKADPACFGSTPGTLALLALTDMLVNLVVSLMLVGSGGEFSYSAVPGFLFHLPLFLLLGVVAARTVSTPAAATDIASALIALSVPIEVSHAVLEKISSFGPFARLEDYLAAPHYYRFFGWWAAAAALHLFRIGNGGLRRLFAPLMFFVLVFPPLWFYSRGDLWVGAGAGSESGELRLTDEVLAAQGRLLDAELARVLPGRKGERHLYFVGFAGDATQDVFLKEVTSAKALFDGRFRTAGRSVVLANNPQSGTTLPFATADNLERTLVRLGEVMAPEDMLFLYVTSHGSRDHELDVNNTPLELKPLTPEQLRRMLSKAKIPYKVVVVSACFSGGFVDPLRDDTSLIITAADATHESFGCGFGEDYTWFGKALVGDALRRTYSFTDAFEKAREEIRKWEEEQNETPSNPQIWGGKEIWPRLAVIEKELQREGNKKP